MKVMKKVSSNIAVVLMAVAICFVLNTFVSAQDETSATINVQVSDSNGAVVANASVIIKNNSTGIERRVQTNEDGSYTISPLIPGEYTLTVEQSGFKKYVQNVTLNAKDRRSIQVGLEVGAASEVVTVTDQPPLVQDSPVGQALVSGNQIVELPLNNRNFVKLLETVPGVSSDLSDEAAFGLTSTISVSINGMRRNAVNYTVDGVSNTDVGSNITLLSTPTVDSILEFKVLSSNFTAEVGRSGGGSVIVVTKGGGNKFHGSLYEFVRNDYFSANNFFNNRLGTNATTGLPNARTPKLRYHNFGGTISGPVVLPRFGEGTPYVWKGTDKTFFFYSEEVRRVIRGIADAGATVPSAAERTGDLSANLGLPICTNAAGTAFATTCSGNTPLPLMATDTAGNSIQVRQNQVFRPSDNRPYAGNIIPLADIDPRSLGLLQAFPLPNGASRNGFTFTPFNINNTRQETFRIDHNISAKQHLFGRYTHDLSQTQEAGGLFTNIGLPNIATTRTNVPGQVMAISYSGVFNNLVNEATFSYSSNKINSVLIGNSRKSNYANAGNIQEFFPENNAGVIPTFSSRFTTVGALQGYTIEYSNVAVRDVLTFTTGNHILKFGGEVTRELKNENTGANTQGSYAFSIIQSQGISAGTLIAGTGDSFGSFLLGRANTYSEAATDFGVNFRFGRYEFFAQDTWKARSNLTLDFGVRYQYYIPPYDKFNKIGSFDPKLYSSSKVTCSTAACSSFVIATTDANNGFGIAGSTSRFGRSIVRPDKNNFSPRVGISWDPFKTGRTVVRAGYGLYYDQALIGVFEQAAFGVPAFSPSGSFTSTSSSVITFTTPNAGAPPGTLPTLGAIVSIDPDFVTPITQQFSLGVQREVFKNAVVDISYVGTRGSHLLRRRNINFVTPADTVAAGTANVGAVRPFRRLGTINSVETTSRSNYNGLLSSFNYRLSKGFTITLAYTFSKNLTDASNDRDAVDDPQNPFNIRPEYAEARTSRPHIFSASYVYEIPLFKKSDSGLVRTFLSGWQVSGITNIESGAPVARVTVADTLSGQRGLYPNIVSDPNSGLAGTIDASTGLPFIFDPLAFAPAANGSFGNSPRAFARLPGRNQTNLAFTKNFYFGKESSRFVQIRAESFNIFNHTQFTGIGTTLPTAGGLSTAALGRPSTTRLPREFQFAAKLYF
jgi:hypothetical protein